MSDLAGAVTMICGFGGALMAIRTLRWCSSSRPGRRRNRAASMDVGFAVRPHVD